MRKKKDAAKEREAKLVVGMTKDNAVEKDTARLPAGWPLPEPEPAMTRHDAMRQTATY